MPERAPSIHNIRVSKSPPPPPTTIFWRLQSPCPCICSYTTLNDRCTLCAHKWFIFLSCSFGSSLKKKMDHSGSRVNNRIIYSCLDLFSMCDLATPTKTQPPVNTEISHIQHINYCYSIILTTCTKHSWHVLCVLVCRCFCSQHKYPTTPEESTGNCQLIFCWFSVVASVQKCSRGTSCLEL